MNTLLILNAKLIDEDLQNLMGKVTPVQIAIENKLIIDHIYSKANKVYEKIIILAKEGISVLNEYIKTKNYDIEIIELDTIKDIGYSVNYALRKIKNLEDIDNFSILYGDTLIHKFNFFNRDLALISEADDSERWTTIEFVNKEKTDFVIHDKKSINSIQEFLVFIGYFNFTDISCFKLVLNNCIVNNNMDMDSFYSSLLEYNLIYKIKLIEVSDWLDFGHIDKYFNIKKDVETRFFNSIEIDKNTSILTKRSEEKKKFINEIFWYLNLPLKLQYLTPRIFEYSTMYSEPFIKMEYYSYSTLHSMYVYGNYTINQWKLIIKKLLYVNKELKIYRLYIKKNEIKEALKDVYYNKTISRLNRLKDNTLLKKFFNESIIINGKKYNGLNFYMTNLDKWLSNIGIYDIKYFNIIHGDYFFGNILYDIRCNIVKLIDPRGDFGGYGIYGDNRYDIAKLSHSIDGKYDHIVADMFKIEETDESINYEIKCNKYCDKTVNVFYRLIEEEYDLKQVKFIQSLLFLSMVPLHNDNLKRQKVMLATGIEILHTILNSKDFINVEVS